MLIQNNKCCITEHFILEHGNMLVRIFMQLGKQFPKKNSSFIRLDRAPLEIWTLFDSVDIYNSIDKHCCSYMLMIN